MSQPRESSARSRYLGAELRKRRERANWSALQLAQRVGWAASTVSRLESGERGVTPVNLATYLAMCDVVGNEQAALLELSRGREDGWWTCSHGDVLPDEVPALRFQQEAANRITCYHPGIIPELLQTEEYADWQLRDHLSIEVALDLVDRLVVRVQERLDRQHVLYERERRSWVFYLDENALRALPGDAAAGSGQLVHLAMLVEQQQARIRVIPTELVHLGAAIGRFWVFGFEAYAPVVCAQTDTISLFGERESDVAAYQRILDRLETTALSELDSLDLIVKLADEHPIRPGQVCRDGTT